ncbi:ATP-dependent zinc metalloprotease FtsH, partial [Patescibacteria group bacterium]|nr:ATP-dependent zinc metalloprotease FtsH [Patescibacteria group bacterium]
KMSMFDKFFKKKLKNLPTRKAMARRGKNGDVVKEVEAVKDKARQGMPLIPKEILDRLPPGVKIKQIVIGPQQIIRAVLYVLIIFWIFSLFKSSLFPETIERASLSEVVEVIKSGRVEEIIVMDDELVVKLYNEEPSDVADGRQMLSSSKEGSSSFVEILQGEGVDLDSVNIRIENRAGWKAVGEILTMLASIVLPLLLLMWFLRRSGGMGGNGGIFGMGKSRARLFVKGKQKMSFKDVAGVEEAKKDLEEIVDFLKNPKKYQKMGARTPKGVLLVGPSGVGKTLLAKALAGEAKVPFFSMAGSEFMEMLVGVGASRARDLFATAKKAGKAIIFIDEIDAIGRMRGGVATGGHGEREQTLNQILVEMDGFEPNTTVIVLAATNRADLLDPALLRPGRFDRTVVLEMPDIKARKDILKIHARGKPFDKSVNWESVARRTVGFSGADIENMLNEAAIGAARLNKKDIDSADIEEAALKVKLGSEKKRVQTENDKLMTAYHEAGHAIVNFAEELDSVHRISIVSRGMALGFTLIPPKKDRVHETKSRLLKQMAMAMGGRAAEELVFKDITTGAASDISHATRMARDMVIKWGMSQLGPINFGPQVDVTEWGSMYMNGGKVSEGMMEKVDEEIKKFVNEAYKRAFEILKKNRKKMDKVAEVLTEKESLDQDEFEELMSRNKS